MARQKHHSVAVVTGKWNPDGKGVREIPDPSFRSAMIFKFWKTMALIFVGCVGLTAGIVAIPERVAS